MLRAGCVAVDAPEPLVRVRDLRLRPGHRGDRRWANAAQDGVLDLGLIPKKKMPFLRNVQALCHPTRVV